MVLVYVGKTPTYAIISYWDGIVFRTEWVPYRWWQTLAPEAEKLIARYKGNKPQTFAVPRYKAEGMKHLVPILLSLGFQASMECLPVAQRHYHTLTLVRGKS